MTVLIRPMRDDDLERIVDLQWTLNLFEDAIAHDRVTDREGARLCVLDNLANTNANGGATLVACLDNAVVGYLSLAFKEAEVFIHPDKRRHGYVQDIVVDAAHRGGGVAQALLAEAERITRSAGLKVVGLGMLVGNEKAERAYRQFGFRPHTIEMLKQLD